MVLVTRNISTRYRVLKVPLSHLLELIRQATDTPSQGRARIKVQNLWEFVCFLVCRRKPECPEKTYQYRYGIGKPIICTQLLASPLVKSKCYSTNQTTLPQGHCESWYWINTWLRWYYRQYKVALIEVKIGLLQRERQTKFNSQISANSDIWFWEIAAERFFVFYCFCQYIDN